MQIIFETIPPALGGVFAAALGLAFGSFVTLASYRLPRDEPIIAGRSRCPSCKTPLAARDLVPVVSWLLQRRRCRRCGAPVSPRYAIIEVVLGALFVAVYLRLGAGVEGLFLAGLAVGLVILAAVDIEAGIIPDKVLIVLAPLALAYQFALGDALAGLAGGALAGGVAAAVRLVFLRLRGREGLGLGDVKFFAVAGLWLGPMGVPGFMVVSGLAGAIFARLWRRMGGGEEFPFGPALALGLFLSLLFPGLATLSF